MKIDGRDNYDSLMRTVNFVFGCRRYRCELVAIKENIGGFNL